MPTLGNHFFDNNYPIISICLRSEPMKHSHYAHVVPERFISIINNKNNKSFFAAS